VEFELGRAKWNRKPRKIQKQGAFVRGPSHNWTHGEGGHRLAYIGCTLVVVVDSVNTCDLTWYRKTPGLIWSLPSICITSINQWWCWLWVKSHAQYFDKSTFARVLSLASEVYPGSTPSLPSTVYITPNTPSQIVDSANRQPSLLPPPLAIVLINYKSLYL
jgi:hypothetical protein